MNYITYDEQDKFYKQVTRIDNKINKIQTQIDATKGKGSKKIKQAFTNKINGRITKDIVKIQNCLPAGFCILKIEIENSENVAE